MRYAILAAIAALSITTTAHASSRPPWATILNDEQWEAVQVFAPIDRYTMARIAFCESRFDSTAIGSMGERGAFQVMPQYWGYAGPSLFTQALQARDIMLMYGTYPWTTRDGCEQWDDEQRRLSLSS